MSATEVNASQRVFFALWPSPAQRDVLAAWRDDLVFPATSDARLMRTENLHITLEFLGTVDAQQLRMAEAAAAGVAQPPGSGDNPPRAFELVLDHYGHFPRARVLFAAASRIPRAARDLQNRLRNALATAGLAVDSRPWAPHVTLWRKVRQLPPLPQQAPLVWPVRRFCLVASVTHARGVQYKVLKAWPLFVGCGKNG